MLRLLPSFASSIVMAFLAVAMEPITIVAQSETTKAKSEVWVLHYWDEAHQLVTTVTGKSWLPLSSQWFLGVKGLTEWIRLAEEEHAVAHPMDHTDHTNHTDMNNDPGGGTMGDVDAVSGASIQGHSHKGLGEARGEGSLSLRRIWAGSNPGSLGASFRYSGESDFHSGMLTLNGSREFFQRNTALSGYVGAGMDYSNPTESPPGQRGLWPANSGRLAASVQVGQLLSPRIQVGMSYAISYLEGMLENPYRRARVITTLFPEQLPETRVRHVFGAEIGSYMGYGVALFHREGAYFDSWGVRSWIPETGLPIEVGKRWLLTPKHKYYYQLPASFYKTAYSKSDYQLEKDLAGDVRLGHLEGNDYSLTIEYSLRAETNASSLSLSGTYFDFVNLSGQTKMKSYVVAMGWKSPV